MLCRKNGEALLMSDLLHGIGIDHQLRRTARDRSAPAWIEALLRRAGSHVLTTNTFKSLFPDLPDLPRDHDADRMWRLLRACAGDRTGRTVDLSQLRDALAGGRLPDELTAQPSHHLVISTFHRAKGLEFDRVIVVDPGPLRESKDGYEVDPAEEARTLYVALTRAREELHRLPPRITWLVRKHQDTGRWARYGRQKWQRHGLEMLGTDVHSVHPAGTAGFSADPRALQEHLRSELRPAPARPRRVRGSRGAVHDWRPVPHGSALPRVRRRPSDRRRLGILPAGPLPLHAAERASPADLLAPQDHRNPGRRHRDRQRQQRRRCPCGAR